MWQSNQAQIYKLNTHELSLINTIAYTTIQITIKKAVSIKPHSLNNMMNM